MFDEPTTGIHFHDINKLLICFSNPNRKGHSIICIEHNLDVIKSADWIIDMGPKGVLVVKSYSVELLKK